MLITVYKCFNYFNTDGKIYMFLFECLQKWSIYMFPKLVILVTSVR